ncbi:hypothetical protein CGC54_01490 [Capnocytophaga canimorsus]|uniref:Methylmalonyl-CoA mutase n=2 Tax=Capnocytophaga canimorsus TaxID=28188 RepID=A0AAD0E9G5_9FLAO|nr:hypothetical protein CGC54_01490 [Capnocytophaga canimorsus]
MGKVGKKTFKTMKNRFENLTIPINPSQDKIYEHLNFAAGFPPYIRGYTASENLLQSICFKDINIKIEANTQEVVLGERTFFLLKDDRTTDFEKVIAIKLLQAKEIFKTNEKKSENIGFLYIFTNDYLLNIAQIRAIRMFWAKMMLNFNIAKKLPIAAGVHTPMQKYFAAMAGIHQIFYFSENQYFFIENESILLENSMLLKSIDPWAGSQAVEEATQKTYVKLEERFAQISQE